MANGKYADMSTTDKLAAALRAVRDLGNLPADHYKAIGIALAEYDATPAVEVTADAVEVAAEFIYGTFDGSKAHPWVERGNSSKQGDARYIARQLVAKAFPVLVQQVERLKTDLAHWVLKCSTMSAANARLAKELNFAIAGNASFVHQNNEHSDFMRAMREHGISLTEFSAITKIARRLTKERLAQDAATAQAKQAEGGSCS